MPSIKLDDVLRRYAASLQTWKPQSAGLQFAAAAREVTGTPDTYVDHTGESSNIASADYGETPFMLGDRDTGPRTTSKWGPEALPELVRLSDARVLTRDRLFSSQPLTPELSKKVIVAACKTDDLRLAASIFDSLINNPTLPEPHRRALVDWQLRRAETRDVVDPSTGLIVVPKLSCPPPAVELIGRLGLQADPHRRAYAVDLARASGLAPAELKRVVLTASADPSPVVRNRAAPLLFQVAPPSRERITDLVAAFFSKEAKAKLRAEIGREVGTLPPVPDLEGDIGPTGDFYPQRMANAAGFRAEFLGALLGTAPVGAELDFLIELALPQAPGNEGLTVDVLSALRRGGATPQRIIDALNRFSSGVNSNELYRFLSRLSLDLIATDPACADQLDVSREFRQAPASARTALLKQTEQGLAALLRTGAIPLEEVLPRIRSQRTGSELLKAALDRGAKPQELLEAVLSHVDRATPRETCLAALSLLQAVELPPAQLDDAVVKLLSASGFEWNESSRTPELSPDFSRPAGTALQALVEVWRRSTPEAERTEAVVTKVVAALPADSRSWVLRELSNAGLVSPTLERERERVFEQLRTSAMAHASNIGDFTVPASGTVSVGDVELTQLRAAMTFFGSFTPDRRLLLDVAAAIASAKAAPPAERPSALWRNLTKTAPSAIQSLSPMSLIDFGDVLPPKERRAFFDATAQFEADRLETLSAHARTRYDYSSSVWSGLFPFGTEPLLSPAAIVAFAKRIPEMRPTIAVSLATPAAAKVRAEVIREMPELAEAPPQLLRTSVSTERLAPPPLPPLGDTHQTLVELEARLARLKASDAAVAQSPHDNDAFFAQLDVSRGYTGEVFKLAETRQLNTLGAPELSPIVDSLGRAGRWLRFAVQLHRGDSYDALKASFHDLPALDWAGADRLRASQGPEVALGHLLLSGHVSANSKASTEMTQPIVLAAAGRAAAPEALRKQILIDGLFEDPLPALKGVLLWNGPSLDWALPALTELAMGIREHSSGYLKELNTLFPLVVSDQRLSNEDAVRWVVTLVSTSIQRFGHVSAGDLIAVALKRPGLSQEQRQTLIGAAVAMEDWSAAADGMTDDEAKAVSEHMLAAAWASTVNSHERRFRSFTSTGEAEVFRSWLAQQPA